jgi:hypothetical protein
MIRLSKKYSVPIRKLSPEDTNVFLLHYKSDVSQNNRDLIVNGANYLIGDNFMAGYIQRKPVCLLYTMELPGKQLYPRTKIEILINLINKNIPDMPLLSVVEYSDKRALKFNELLFDVLNVSQTISPISIAANDIHYHIFGNRKELLIKIKEIYDGSAN